jgi:hypothetical protein
MIAGKIETLIKTTTVDILSKSKIVEMPEDIIETDNIGEVIEKLAILHCRMWYLEDAIGVAKTDAEIADLKRKIDICFKVKRPKYVEAINRMIDKSIMSGKSLQEDSVKLYKGFTEGKELTATVRRTNPQEQERIKKNREEKIHLGYKDM